MATSRRARGSGGIGSMLRRGGGPSRKRRGSPLDISFGEDFDLGFDDDFDDELPDGGLGAGMDGGASSGAADVLMAMFDDEGGAGDPFDDMASCYPGVSGSGASSSSMRPAKRKATSMAMENFLDSPQMRGSAGKHSKGRRGPLLPEEMLGDPLDDDFYGDEFGPEDDFEDEFHDDFHDDFHDAFPDDFNDDLLAQLRPRQRKRSVFKIVHRFNPFGRLQLPPLRKRRQDLIGEAPQTEPSASSTTPAASSTVAASKTPANLTRPADTSLPAEEVICGAGSSAASAVVPKADDAGLKARGADVAGPAAGGVSSLEPAASSAGHASIVAGSASSTVAAFGLKITAAQSTLAPNEELSEPSAAPAASTAELQEESEAATPVSDTAKAAVHQSSVPSVDSAASTIARDAADDTGSTAAPAALLPRPRMPVFAFEFFCNQKAAEAGKESIPVDETLLRQWRMISDEERSEFLVKAEEDKIRFEEEYSDWLKQQSELGFTHESTEEVVNEKRVEMENNVAQLEQEARGGIKTPRGLRLVAKHGRVRVASQSPGRLGSVSQSPGRLASKSPAPEARRRRRLRRVKPEGFPEDARSAYKIFCHDHKEKLAGAAAVDDEAAAVDGAPADVPGDGQKPRNRRGMETLKKLREAWKSLSAEERQEYETKADAEAQRFAEELEAWRQKQPEGGLGEAAEYYREKSKKLPRPARHRSRTPARRRSRTRDLPPTSRSDLDSVLLGAVALKTPAPTEEQRANTQSQKSIAEVAATVQVEQDDDGWANIGNIENDDLFAGLPSSAPLSSSAGSGTIHTGSSGISGLPTPQSAPTAMGPTAPDESVDDLLADFDIAPENVAGSDDPGGGLAETHGLPQSFGPPGGPLSAPEDGAMTLWEEPQAPMMPFFSDIPDTVGAPKILGPQLCFDESGNIVLNQSSLSRKMDREAPAADDGLPVDDVTEYKKAYRRTPPTKWDAKETAQFYEALSLYGTDLFLVQTCFRNKSASQIKTKYNREMKKYPDKVEAALLGQRKKLTTETFERLHGKIDTSKHWKPPPTPEPGQEPEPDGSVPAADMPMPDEEEELPQEPEYTEEDESHTTNRLMALFD